LSAGLLGSAAAFVVFDVAAVRPPRLGFTTVVPLDAVEKSVELLCVLACENARCGDAGALGFGLGGGSIWPFAAAAVSFFSFDAVRVSFAAVAVPPRLACSIMPCTLAEIADDAAVAADFRGEFARTGDIAVVGRAIMLFAGELGR
jgi:hypothetical protein